MSRLSLLSLTFILAISISAVAQLTINNNEYFARKGLNIMVFSDNYPEGHQGGITIIQHESRVAANGDLRLEPAPGQWQPFPELLERKVDKENNTISVKLAYPDSSMIKRNFNPIVYPDLHFNYEVVVKVDGNNIKVKVNLDQPLPKEWIGRVGFNLELFPQELFDKSYILDDQSGIFPRHFNGPMKTDVDGSWQTVPMASGKHLVIAPESDLYRMSISSEKDEIQLIDGRAHHNNGWFVARSLIPDGATKEAVVWEIAPNVIDGWSYQPVIQTSQVGFYPEQPKMAMIECAEDFTSDEKVQLVKIEKNGEQKIVLETIPEDWGMFQRYKYLRFDFSQVEETGLYQIKYDKSTSELFSISETLFDRNVWQPTLEYFLPVQMCHMRVNDRYRVWHGLCHMDDALMAPVDTIHLDGYYQGKSTLTRYKSNEQVPGLNVGGWHDAGDYDLRVESQAGTFRILSLIKENFNLEHDQTLVNQQKKLVEIHLPDGKDDVLQQIEHGVLTVLAGYENLGRLYRGIITPTNRQYVLLGDAINMSDNIPYEPGKGLIRDDRWVFTEENPWRELFVAECLAVASRSLKGYNDELSEKSLTVAKELWEQAHNSGRTETAKIRTLVELILTTNDDTYKKELSNRWEIIEKNFSNLAWTIVRVSGKMDIGFQKKVQNLKDNYYRDLAGQMQNNPYRLPYRPQIWGAGWYIQSFGVEQYFLYKYWNNEASKEYVLNALNFVLGCHPSSNNISYASGVGTKSTVVAYGINRADWSYIPGGVVSGTSYIQPDLPEFKVWPFFWQQGEYVIGGGATNFMFLVLATRELYGK